MSIEDSPRLVRKIIIGDVINGYTISVGQKHKWGKDDNGETLYCTVSRIIKKESPITKELYWNVYVNVDDTLDDILWFNHHLRNISVTEYFNLDY